MLSQTLIKLWQILFEIEYDLSLQRNGKIQSELYELLIF